MDAEHFRRVIQACFPGLPVHSIAFLAEGWSSRVWEVNGSYVFRFPKRAEIHAGLRKEIRLLPALAPLVCLPVPGFEYVWTGGAQYEGPFVGYPTIRGRPMMPEHLASVGYEGPARQLGDFLTSLHRFPCVQALALGIPGGDAASWRHEYQVLYQTVEQRVLPLLSAPARHNLATTWQDFLQDESNFRFTPVLIHRDLSSEHILFDAEQGCVTGIIDWEDATIGDPVFDFTGLLDYGPDFVRQALHAYEGPADEAVFARARFYHAIGPCHEVLFGLDAGLAEHVAAGLAGLRAIWSVPC